MKWMPMKKGMQVAPRRGPRRRLTEELLGKGGASALVARSKLAEEGGRRRSIDVAVMSDATGSMTNELTTIRSHLATFVRELTKRYSALRLSAGFYRDHVPQVCEYDIAIYDGGRSLLPGAMAEQIQVFIEQHGHPDGGGDREDMGEALYRLAQLPWQARTRVVLHIGDQNSHGYGTGDGLCRLSLTTERVIAALKEAGTAVFMAQCGNLVEVEKEYRQIAEATGGKHLRFDELANCDEVLVFLEAAIASKSGGSVSALLAERVEEGRLAAASRLPLLRAFNR